MKKELFDFNIKSIKYPKACLLELSEEIKKCTHDYVLGNVSDYSGKIYSEYEPNELSNSFKYLTIGKKISDIQDALGEVEGNEKTKLEFFLSAKKLKDYKCRLFFVEYGLGGYPVNVVLEEKIAREINKEEYNGFVLRCTNTEEFVDLLTRIIDSKYVHSIVQSVITESLMKEEEEK